MSQRAASQGQHTERARSSRQHGHSQGAGRAGYTLAHAGRQVRFGPVAFWITVGTVVIMGVWSIATATYFAFRDDVLTRLMSRQAEMQFGYEDRIAELRARVDRITSRQLLDQEQFEQKLDQLLRRQATLESRASALSGIADPMPTGAIKPPARNTMDLGQGKPKPSPISDSALFFAPPDRGAWLQTPALNDAWLGDPAKAGGIETTLARLQASLDRIELREAAVLSQIEERYHRKAQRMRGVLAGLGINLGSAPVPPSGGPFVPLKVAAQGNDFERQVLRVNVARTQVERLTRVLVAVPVRPPIAGEIDTTSGFGMRIDPFLRAPAMHTGLDFRGSAGDPVRATAAGTVTTAGWSGGYGKMVEIDHGNGISTRYGHLSAIDVKVGAQVRIGQIVGRIGSTGRSTGPHLHYETRIDGDAVDPEKFLRAGEKLGLAH
jgi:murein DD-endopeptidase MepM/ murein hydrolase activator NlpD